MVKQCLIIHKLGSVRILIAIAPNRNSNALNRRQDRLRFRPAAEAPGSDRANLVAFTPG
jgi:hypothetical protein